MEGYFTPNQARHLARHLATLYLKDPDLKQPHFKRPVARRQKGRGCTNWPSLRKSIHVQDRMAGLFHAVSGTAE
jgi:hypothetical protein